MGVRPEFERCLRCVLVDGAHSGGSNVEGRSPGKGIDVASRQV